MSYSVEIAPAARKILQALPHDIRSRLVRMIDILADTPRPPNVQRLTGYNRRYRLRVGEYRVIYDIDDTVRVVLIVWIGHRREVYRQLRRRRNL